MLEAGTILQNRYLIERQIGQGGMGTVYIAIDQRLNSPVAIKGTLFTDADLQRAFEREAQLLNRLRHPALPRVIDYFTEASQQFLVMEYIAGEDLSAMMKRDGAFEVADVFRWTDDLLGALDYLHSQKPPVIHRDIKPQNLKLMPNGEIILLDFGLAKGKTGDSSELSQTRSILGYSRSYAPLEQIQGTGTDPRSDLYSLSATVYHLLTGSPPVDALTRATAVLNNQPDPLRSVQSLNPKVPSEIAEVFNKALSLNANVRPVSAAEMRSSFVEAAQKNIGNQSGAAAGTDAANIFDSRETQPINAPENIISSANPAVSSAAVANDNLPVNAALPKASLANAAPSLNPAAFQVQIPRSAAVVEAPNVVTTNSRYRKRRSGLSPVGIAAAIAILGGGGFAAWYATANSSSNTNSSQPYQTQGNRRAEINQSAKSNLNSSDTANSLTNMIRDVPSSSNKNTPQSQTSAPVMQTGEATEVVIDDAEQQSSTPRPQAEPVEAPKIIPPARNTRTDENNQTEPTDNSDSAVQDLRELPREVRDKAKDAIKKQSEELRRRVEEENRKRAEKDQPPIPLPPRVQHENQRR